MKVKKGLIRKFEILCRANASETCSSNLVTPLCARVKCIGGVALFRRLKAHGPTRSPIPSHFYFFLCISHETRGNGHGDGQRERREPEGS